MVEQARLTKETEEAAAALAEQHKDAADRLQKQKETEEAAEALALQQKEAADRLQKQKETEEAAEALALQQKEAADQLQKQKEAADQLSKEKEAEEAYRRNEEREGIIRGTYPKQDLYKSIDFLRAHGMGQGWNTDLQLPDKLPTFYVDVDTKQVDHAPEGPKEEPDTDSFKHMILGKVQQEMDRRVPPMPEPKPLSTKKRKRAGRRKHVKLEKVKDETPRNEDSDSDSSVELLQTSANTARRILWQRGHNAMLPSTKQQIIMDATVDSVSEAHGPLCEYGFAIVRDMTEAFAPKHRCTREQRDFITRCKEHPYACFTSLLIYY
jgi:hypothetical protein